jgi:hypothetical protein
VIEWQAFVVVYLDRTGADFGTIQHGLPDHIQCRNARQVPDNALPVAVDVRFIVRMTQLECSVKRVVEIIGLE